MSTERAVRGAERRQRLKLLREQFGHPAFRPGQEQVIDALLEERDVLALLPTGAGKSLVFQLTAQLLPGVTIVVSPLIALMKDQVESIAEQGLVARVINSTLSAGAAAQALHEVREAATKLLYVTPERFADAEFMEQIRRTEVALFVVDEAHCISEWGHSFRAAYLALPEAIRQLGRPTILALTATATPWVRQEIVERLGMRDPALVVRGLDRPNLFYEVRRVESEAEDRRALKHLLLGEPAEYPVELAGKLGQAMQGSGIIYTATTKAARETAEWLQGWGLAVDYYHGQRSKRDRERVQDAFMDGELRVIAATNAFGMGVDKPDVRFVIHRDIPGSLESYYQEAGRAGRDGEFARCTLIYRPGDLRRAAFLSAGGQLTREELGRVWRALLTHDRPLSAGELAEASHVGPADLARATELLLAAKALARRRGRFEPRDRAFDLEQISLAREEQRRAYERSRLEMVRGYAEEGECRRRALLSYFGEEYEAARCAMCDADMPRAGEQWVAVNPDEELHVVGSAPFAVGARVQHQAWGAGVVQRVEAEALTVLFDAAGYKTLALATVQERGLLRPAA